MSTKAPFVLRPDYTSIAIAYANEAFIADAVLPRRPVGATSFKYRAFNKGEGFTIPSTLVGRTGRVNQVEFGSTEVDASVKDYGLEDPVPAEDMANAGNIPGWNPEAHAAEMVTELVALSREKRVADLIFTLGTYPAANRVTLSGTGQWSDFTNSDPVAGILGYLDVPMRRPNVAVFGSATWTKLRQHPKVAKLIHGNSGDVAIVSRQAFADAFDFEEVLVGQSWYNTAKRGQTESYARLWGKHASFIYRDRTAHVGKGITFGLTAQFGTKFAGTIEDPNIGLKGGNQVRVGEQIDELIIANDVAYHVQDAVA